MTGNVLEMSCKGDLYTFLVDHFKYVYVLKSAISCSVLSIGYVRQSCYMTDSDNDKLVITQIMNKFFLALGDTFGRSMKHYVVRVNKDSFRNGR